MSYQRPFAPDRVEEAGRAAVRGGRGEVPKEEGAMARATALLALHGEDAAESRKAARTAVRLTFRHGHEQPGGTVRLACADLAAHEADRAAARRVLDMLGLLPAPPAPARAPVALTSRGRPQKRRTAPGAAKSARIAECGGHLHAGRTPAQAAAAMGIGEKTAKEYGRLWRAERAPGYFEARGAGFGQADAAELAGMGACDASPLEREWQLRTAGGGEAS